MLNKVLNCSWVRKQMETIWIAQFRSISNILLLHTDCASERTVKTSEDYPNSSSVALTRADSRTRRRHFEVAMSFTPISSEALPSPPQSEHKDVAWQLCWLDTAPVLPVQLAISSLPEDWFPSLSLAHRMWARSPKCTAPLCKPR